MEKLILQNNKCNIVFRGMVLSRNVNRSINILLIGMGQHAKETYIPAFAKTKKDYDLHLLAVVELKKKENEIKEYLYEREFTEYTNFFAATERPVGEEFLLDDQLKMGLDKTVLELGINAVVISTDPMCHFAYIEWALKSGLNVLADKPLTLHPNSSIDQKQANKIYDDAIYLTNLARNTKDAQNGDPITFMVLTQRRYQSAYIDLRNKVEEVFKKTGCPITSLSILHNDGQWSFPNELVTDQYHGFNEGVGKLSHTGYHLIDIVPWMLRACVRKDLVINKVRVQASAVRPSDLIYLLPHKCLSQYFGNEYNEDQYKNEIQLANDVNGYGEVDAYLSYIFYHDDIPVCTANLNLLHSGLSQRTWTHISPGQINGKGRIKHELVHLYQGPFLGAELEKIRGKKEEYTDSMPKVKVRYILNKKESGNEKVYDYIKSYPQYKDALTEDRFDCIQEFVREVNGKHSSLRSSADDHLASIKLLTMSYAAIAKSYENDNNSVIDQINLS